MAHRDRISALPDDLLHRILSFLPTTTDRACTSLLSRRWRHLWTHHPSIHFTCLVVLSAPSLSASAVSAAARAYISAVDACLRAFKPPTVDNLSLDLWLPTSSSPSESCPYAWVADRWLRFAAIRSARTLSLCAVIPPSSMCIHNPQLPLLPGAIFSCDRDLAELALSFCAVPAPPPDFPGFRSLKTLYFSGCAFSQDTLAGLLACCPVLQSLTVICCLGLFHVEVRSPSLTRLVWKVGTIVTTVEAPNLQVLECWGDLKQLHLKGSPALREAVLKVDLRMMNFEKQEDWLKLVGAISGVSILSVNSWFYQFVIPEREMFSNLKELNCDGINWITGSVLHALVSNLRRCPMLEKLILEFSYERWLSVKSFMNTKDVDKNLFMQTDALLKDVEDNHEADGFNLPENFLEPGRPLCHLRTVMLREFLGSKNEMLLAKFLLGSAISLKKFIVFDVFQGDFARTKELHLLFAPIPKASSQLQMKFYRRDKMNIGSFK